ncbi:undecaprenyl-diphosphate phosphatase, partial [Candidatus Woesearchaeota archaeon]|nr:undecaprenyl-diphosphate phosphatase [Candidatus Woesearchaeota archaeon]
AFSSLLPVGIALLITGTFLHFCEKFTKNKKITLLPAIIIGIAQGLAIMPGISRSGATIATALFFGTQKKEAVRFSFLLFIPAMIGATVLQAKNITNNIQWTPIIIGTFFAVIIGYASLKLLILIVNKKRLSWFSYYCWIIGILVILLSFKF